MPGTPDGVRDHEASRERAAVMGARGADREKLIAAPRQEDGILTDVPCEHASVGEVVDRDAPRKVGARRTRLFCAHRNLRMPILRLEYSCRVRLAPLDRCTDTQYVPAVRQRSSGGTFAWEEHLITMIILGCHNAQPKCHSDCKPECAWGHAPCAIGAAKGRWRLSHHHGKAQPASLPACARGHTQ